MTTFRGTNKAFGKIAVAASLIIGTIGGGAIAAHAQSTPNAVIKPLAIKLGVYAPSKIDARRVSGSTLFSAEIEYTVQSIPEQNSSYSVASLGYINRGKLRIIPFTIGQIFTDGKLKYYYGGGIGLYNIKLDSPGYTQDARAKNLFGFYGEVGVNFTRQVFAEIKYHYPYKYEHQFVGGLELMGGLRF